MNEEIPYNPPGLSEYIREGARKNAALLRKMQGKPEAVETEKAQGQFARCLGYAAWRRKAIKQVGKLYDRLYGYQAKQSNTWSQITTLQGLIADGDAQGDQWMRHNVKVSEGSGQ